MEMRKSDFEERKEEEVENPLNLARGTVLTFEGVGCYAFKGINRKQLQLLSATPEEKEIRDRKRRNANQYCLRQATWLVAERTPPQPFRLSFF